MGTKGRIIAGILAVITLSILWLTVYFLVNKYQVSIITLLNSPKMVASVLVFGSAGWLLFKKLPEQLSIFKKLADIIRKIRTGKAILPMVYLFSILTAIPSLIAYIYLRVFNPKFLEIGK
jgi:hypothetical protein